MIEITQSYVASDCARVEGPHLGAPAVPRSSWMPAAYTTVGTATGARAGRGPAGDGGGGTQLGADEGLAVHIPHFHDRGRGNCPAGAPEAEIRVGSRQRLRSVSRVRTPVA